MGVPRSATAKRYYRCALQRMDEAKILFKAVGASGGKTTSGPMYLAGYTVECMLKALIFASLPQNKHAEMMTWFRRGHGHDLSGLRIVYLQNGGARFPADITRSFTLVSDWETEIRYDPKQYEVREVEAFLEATQAILEWANRRL